MQAGNSDSLGTELLESLLKMAPTKEEERKLKEFKDDSLFKLGPAEKFLKAVLDIPFAFKRVDAMLYVASFDSEVDYLKRSFETLEVNLSIFFYIFVMCIHNKGTYHLISILFRFLKYSFKFQTFVPLLMMVRETFEFMCHELLYKSKS